MQLVIRFKGKYIISIVNKMNEKGIKYQYDFDGSLHTYTIKIDHLEGWDTFIKIYTKDKKCLLVDNKCIDYYWTEVIK